MRPRKGRGIELTIQRRLKQVEVETLRLTPGSPCEDESGPDGSLIILKGMRQSIRRIGVVPMDHDLKPENNALTSEEARGWVEFACWTTLALAPFLYWVNGPAVSTDQVVVRTGLIVIACIGASGLRAYAWLRRRSK